MMFDKYNHGETEVYRVVTGQKWKENSYLIIDNERMIKFIIDPGKDFINLLDLRNFGEYEVAGILLTHAHHDHLSGAADLSQHLNVPCILSLHEKRLWMHVNTYSIRFTGEAAKRPENILWIDNGVEAQLNNYGIKIIYSPGHTTGSCCYSFKNLIFTGDTLMYKMIGRTDLPGSDKENLNSTIDSLLSKCENETTIYSGHGEPWNIKDARSWWMVNRADAQEHNLFLND